MYKKILFSFLLSVFVSFLFVAGSTKGDSWGDYWRLEGDRLVAIQGEVLQFCLSDGATCVTPPVAAGGGDVFGTTSSIVNQIVAYSTTDGKGIKPTVGFYNKADGTVVMGTSSDFYFDGATDRLGIGNSFNTPRSLLHLGLVSEASNILTIGNGNSTVSGIEGYNGDLAAVSFSMRSDASGNFNIGNNITDADITLQTSGTGGVGIGVTNPVSFVQIGDPSNGDFEVALARGLDANSGFNWYNGVGVDASVKMLEDEQFYITNAVAGGDILLDTTATGNVGIGVTEPTEKLHLVGNFLVGTDDFFVDDTAGRVGIGTTETSNGRLNVATDTGVGLAVIDGSDILKIGGGSIETNDIFTINTVSQANVGIGTTAPTSKLDVEGTNVGLSVTTLTATRDGTGSGVGDIGRVMTLGYSDFLSGTIQAIFQLGGRATNSDDPFIIEAFRTGTDLNGNISLNPGGGKVGIGNNVKLPTAFADIGASTATIPSLRLRYGVANTSNQNIGDIWHDDDGLHVRVSAELVKHFTPKEVVNVLTLEDLPAPDVNGYIHLLNKRYNILREIVFDGTAATPVKGFDIDTSTEIIGAATIYYVNQSAAVDALFTGATLDDSLIFLKSLQTISDGSGRLFDLTGDPKGIVLLDKFIAGGFFSLGQISNMSYFGIVANYIQNVFEGLTLTDNDAVAIQSHRFSSWIAGNATFITIAGDQGSVQLNNNFFEPLAGEKALNITGTTTGGSVVGNAFDTTGGGVIFESGSQTQTDPFWTYSGNTTLADSTTAGEIWFQNNTTDTDILTIDIAKKVNATYSAVNLERITNTNGVLTYIGLEDIKLNALAVSTIEPASTPASNLSTYIGKTEAALFTVTFDEGADTFTSATLPASDTSIRLSNSGGALPAGLYDDQFYWTIGCTTTCQLANLEGGVAIDFTTAGTGTNSYSLGELIPRSEKTVNSNNGSPGLVVSNAIVKIKTGDKLELFTANETNTNDVTVITTEFMVTKP